MASTYYEGKIQMQVVEDDKKEIDYTGLEEYPYVIPRVFLRGCGKAYFPQVLFDWDDDSVIVVRNRPCPGFHNT